jgi:hypothetical protein
MSLESKFENLSIGEEASIIEAIKKDGVDKSGFASSIDVLVAKCDSTDDDVALAALATAKAISEGCPEAEAFNKECLTACKFVLVYGSWESSQSRRRICAPHADAYTAHKNVDLP